MPKTNPSPHDLKCRFNGALKRGADPAALAQLLSSFGVQAVGDTAALTPAERVKLYRELTRREAEAIEELDRRRANHRRHTRRNVARRRRKAAQAESAIGA